MPNIYITNQIFTAVNRQSKRKKDRLNATVVRGIIAKEKREHLARGLGIENGSGV